MIFFFSSSSFSYSCLTCINLRLPLSSSEQLRVFDSIFRMCPTYIACVPRLRTNTLSIMNQNAAVEGLKLTREYGNQGGAGHKLSIPANTPFKLRIKMDKMNFPKTPKTRNFYGKTRPFHTEKHVPSTGKHAPSTGGIFHTGETRRKHVFHTCFTRVLRYGVKTVKSS